MTPAEIPEPHPTGPGTPLPGVGAGQHRVPLARAGAQRPLYLRPSYLAVLLAGGMLGTGIRSLLEQAHPAAPESWPWTTFGINVVGSFLLGALLTALARGGPDLGSRRHARLGLGTGFCGGLTTYSTFIVEVDSALRAGAGGVAVAYAVVSVLVGIAAALAGVLLARGRPGPARGQSS